MGHFAAVWDCKAATEITKDGDGFYKFFLGTLEVFQQRFAYMEDMSLPGEMSKGKNFCLPVPKPSLSLRKLFEVVSIFVSHSLVTAGHSIYMDLLGARFGRSMMIPHLSIRMIPMVNPSSTCCLNLPMKISSAGLTGKSTFEFRLRVSLAADGSLSLISRIRNVNGKPFSFLFAYHTYLSVSDISEVRIEGLETLDYLDNLCRKERFTEQGDAITFESEVDRVYLSTPNVVAVLDHEKKRTYVIRKEGLPDVVLWNPWEKKSKAMVDFGDDEYKQMLCVDGAAIEKTLTLKPGEEWTGKIEVSVVPSTFCSESFDLQSRRF